jgi:hypothetical protein
MIYVRISEVAPEGARSTASLIAGLSALATMHQQTVCLASQTAAMPPARLRPAAIVRDATNDEVGQGDHHLTVPLDCR